MSKQIKLGLPALALPLITAMMVWGGFPKPPEVFVKLARNELFQYFLVFLWVWQSYGSGQDIQTALIATVVLFLITKFLDLRAIVGALSAPPQVIVLPPPQPPQQQPPQ